MRIGKVSNATWLLLLRSSLSRCAGVQDPAISEPTRVFQFRDQPACIEQPFASPRSSLTFGFRH